MKKFNNFWAVKWNLHRVRSIFSILVVIIALTSCGHMSQDVSRDKVDPLTEMAIDHISIEQGPNAYVLDNGSSIIIVDAIDGVPMWQINKTEFPTWVVIVLGLVVGLLIGAAIFAD